MKKISTLLFVFCAIISVNAQVPAQSQDVMLQGFYWDSWNSSTTVSPQGTTRWTDLYQISGELSGVFDIIWLPPSALSSGGTGYVPSQWNNQNGAWGDVDNLKKLIIALKANNCRAMADIVVNHRNARGVNSSWTDFFPDDFGAYGQFQFDRSHICITDEATASASVPANQKPTGAADTGDDFSGGRDLDHTNVYVQNAIKAYLQWMKNVMGYDGWRYDMVKGFSGSYIQGYNNAVNAYMSVGEFWDGAGPIQTWINNTGKTSAAFDFPLKYDGLRDGLAAGNYANMGRGLAYTPSWSKYAVTFVDNHDTYRNDNKYLGNVPQAYALLMSSPGIPCVFYPHWKLYKTDINNMIKARKAVGLTSESQVTVQNTSGYFKSYSIGIYGEMLTYIGSTTDVPGTDWTLACSGGTGTTSWKIYTHLNSTQGQTAYQAKLNAGVNPQPAQAIGTITLTGTLPSTWTSPKIWVWDLANATTNFTGGVWPGVALTSLGNGKFTITLSGITAKEVGVIFNDGISTATGEQTYDLSTTTDACWNVETPGSGRYYAAIKVVCNTTSVDNTEVQHFNIYPNPVNNELKIANFNGVGNYEITDLSGKQIVNGNWQNGQSIDVSNLVSGIYFIKIGNQIEKFVKK